jgi:hypothetical protein
MSNTAEEDMGLSENEEEPIPNMRAIRNKRKTNKPSWLVGFDTSVKRRGKK